MIARFPTFGHPRLIAMRADRICDPVERLRFLRRAMSAKPRRRAAWLIAPLLLAAATTPMPRGAAESIAATRVARIQPETTPASPNVWRVEHSQTTDVYSNGLRIDLTFTVNNRPRARFPVYSPEGGPVPIAWRDQPVGIVFHMSESNVAPFEEDATRRLRQLGRNLLEVIRQERAYHFVIDRFGRVWAVVAESDAANHAGNSIWSDAGGVYVNLNDSFLGVSFEGQTEASSQITPAQIHAARILTEMLRSRYRIAAGDCVTHAQVSVNPLNMRIGNHVDWAGDFPFEAVGLPDNYSIPPASLYVFGFDYDNVFVRATGGRWKGLGLAVDRVDRSAAAQGIPVERYRKILQHRYKDISGGIHEQ